MNEPSREEFARLAVLFGVLAVVTFYVCLMLAAEGQMWPAIFTFGFGATMAALGSAAYWEWHLKGGGK